MVANSQSENEFTQFIKTVQDQVVDDLRKLLQEKHLYQSLTVAVGRIPHTGDDRPALKQAVTWTATRIRGPWSVNDPQNARLTFLLAQQGATDVVFNFTPPDVKLFCTTCDRLEPFNLISAEDAFQRESGRPSDGVREGSETFQTFVLVYRCQGCKGAPEVLLVRRKGFRLTNCGRAPIEHVEVPKDVPKAVQHFYSGAMVAHQSGQTLAGLFLLRTLIEQFARSESGSTSENADQVMEAYMATLPADFKGRFPSLRELYGEVSVDLHSARGSPDLFDRARAQIAAHFETRRVFKLAAGV